MEENDSIVVGNSPFRGWDGCVMWFDLIILSCELRWSHDRICSLLPRREARCWRTKVLSTFYSKVGSHAMISQLLACWSSRRSAHLSTRLSINALKKTLASLKIALVSVLPSSNAAKEVLRRPTLTPTTSIDHQTNTQLTNTLTPSFKLSFRFIYHSSL